MPPARQPRASRHTFLLGSLLAALLALLLVFGQRQAIFDWFKLHGYQPPAAVAAIARDDTMTSNARHIFYVNHPQLQSKQAFAQSCPNGDQETAVLGCYIPDQQGIYVLAVDDSRLAGIEQVTAAHELLHAAYDRLSVRERQQVDGWLQDYYQHGLHDAAVRKQLESYKKTEPNDLVNEMHSIFGSEVGGLPKNLEQYYARYFTDRSKITGYYNDYQAEFTSRQLQIAQDDARLSRLKQQISSLQSSLQSQQAGLARQQAQLENYRRAGNAAAYNARVPAYNAAISAYNKQVDQLQQLVADYNRLVAARNALALEEQQLVQDISSQVSPIDKQ